MQKVINFWTNMINRIDQDITIELDAIIYCNKRGHEICVMHLIGKNVFPKMTTDEILRNPKAMSGLSKEDLITIAQLDMQIKQRKHSLQVVEFDRNGTVVLEDQLRTRKRYSEKLLISQPEILDRIKGKDAFSLGYRIGYTNGNHLKKIKFSSMKKLFAKFFLNSHS